MRKNSSLAQQIKDQVPTHRKTNCPDFMLQVQAVIDQCHRPKGSRQHGSTAGFNL